MPVPSASRLIARRLRAVALVCTLALTTGLGASPAAAQPVDEDPAVVRARARLAAEDARADALSQDLDEAARAYEHARAHQLRLEEEAGGQAAAVSAAADHRTAADEAFERSVAEAYMHPVATEALAEAVVLADDAGTALHRAALVAQVSAWERAHALEAADTLTRVAVDTRQHEVVRAGVRGVVAEVEREAADLQDRLAAARQEVAGAQQEVSAAERAARARIEAERRAAAARAAAERAAAQRAAAARAADQAAALAARSDLAPPPAVDGKVCPIGAPNAFIDSWGFPRSGGRRHQGVDMFAEHGMPLYAVADGTITRVYSNRLGGLSINLVDDAGDRYYYAHLSSAAVVSGQRVTAGEVIGANGDSGNARGTPPHLHWQHHPGGGAAVNPYPLAAALCR